MLNRNQVTTLLKRLADLEPSQKKDLIKRLADASEKFALAGLALGVFQDNTSAGMIGLAFFGICLILTLIGGAR